MPLVLYGMLEVNPSFELFLQRPASRVIEHALTRSPIMHQLRKRPIDRSARRREEDHETVQHPGPIQENIPRTETAETPAT